MTIAKCTGVRAQRTVLTAASRALAWSGPPVVPQPRGHVNN